MKRFYDKEALMDAADALSVAEFIGMDIKYSDVRSGKKNISVLCPVHNDIHHGSCYLTNYGFHCFSCGAHGDIIDMVRRHYGWDTSDKSNYIRALDIIADACGGRELYLIDASEKRMQTETIYKPLSIEKLKLIGLYDSEHNRGLYQFIGIRDVNDDENRPLKKGEYVEWSGPLFDNKDDEEKDSVDEYEIIYECVDKNPIMTLFNEDIEAYLELIRNKCHEFIERYENLKELCYNNSYIIIACQELIREIENILIEYGGKIKEKRKETEVNIFGKIAL